MERGRLFVISGPSGTGKGTICKSLKDELSSVISVSMTTRAPRVGEIEGKSYYFVSKQAFGKVIEDDGFLEYAQVFGDYYGTPKAPVLNTLSMGLDVFLEIDIQGAVQVKANHPEAVLIFILPPSLSELKNRIVKRGTETEAVIEKRLSKATVEIAKLPEYDYCIINDVLKDAVAKVVSIVRAEHLKVNPSDAQEIINKYK